MSKWRTLSFLVVYATQLATAQNHSESFQQVKYRTYTFSDAKSKDSCSGWWWGYGCVKEYYLEYRIATESVIETISRCQRGWSPHAICNVLNPCAAETSGCQQRCNYGGTNATYFCSCKSGHELETDGHRCKHMDECTKRGSDCRQMENFICQYTSGGYQCICKDGFTLVDPKRCSDLDECVAGTDNCNTSENFVCQNTIGGYECVCRQGFLLDDSQQCIDIDECATLTDSCNASENTVCQNTIGAYACVCGQGFILDEFEECVVGISWLAKDNVVGILIIAAIAIGSVLVTASVIVAICVCYRNKGKRVIERVVTTEDIYENSTEVCSSSRERVVTAEAIYENSTEMCSSSKENDTVDADPCVYQEMICVVKGPETENVYEALRDPGRRRRKINNYSKTSKM